MMRLAAFGFKCERPLLADCVEKLENHGPPKISQMQRTGDFLSLQGAVESIRGSAIVFAVIDVVLHIAAREMHQRS